MISCCLLLILALLCAVEGTWGFELHHSRPFVLVALLVMLSVGVVLFICQGRSALFHWGIFIVLIGMFFGAADVSQGQAVLMKNTPTHIAVGEDGNRLTLPFEMTLKEFRIDYYEDGVSPKQYTSIIEVDGKELSTSVNHPCRVKGYYIYQSDYDKAEGCYSVLKVVRDPWLWAVVFGMCILAGAAVKEIRLTWQKRGLFAVVALAVIFAVASLCRIRFGTLAPALRSFWFIPHLIIYMLAYSALAIALVTGIIGLCKSDGKIELSRKWLSTASSLLLLGMLFGALWAKAAWGDYWTWDAKENWAAVTWLLTLVGLHLPSGSKKGWLVIATAAAFLAMQVTWYGVNYLPAAAGSLHTY